MHSNPRTWTTDQLEQWLKINEFNDCIDILCREKHFNGNDLLSLTDSQVDSLTNNSQLNAQIQHLKTVYIEIEEQFHHNCCYLTTIRSDRMKTFIAFVLLLLAVFVCSFVITIVDERLPDPKSFPPLPDLILENIGPIPWAFSVTEKIIVAETIILISVIIAHRHKLIILRRLFIITAALYFLRSLTMLFTSLPVATRVTDCQPKSLENFHSHLKKTLMIFFGQGMSSFGVKTCGDYLYSGHTCTLVLTTQFINEYTPRSYYILHCLTWLCALTGMFFILAGHQHYSIDILIAFVLSSRLFIYYHTLANNRIYLQHDIDRLRIWSPLFSYFEANVQTAIPNEYSCPEIFNKCRLLFIRHSFCSFCLVLVFIVTYSLSFTNTIDFYSLIKR